MSEIISKGTGNKIISAIVEKLPEVFLSSEGENGQYVKILYKGKEGRQYRYISRDYLQDNNYIDTYNVVLPESNGNGAFESFTSPMIATPGMTTTDTFLSIGTFTDEMSAEALLKYIKTKFVRALLGIKKVTQHNPKSTWVYVPMQDFSQDSYIDWDKNVAMVDQQLYKKYDLSQSEIDFIEKHVKEMT